MLATAAVLLVVGLLIGAAAPIARTVTLPLREREFSSGGAWSWFGDPRAVYHAGAHHRTYVGWDAPDGSIQVASYDHDSGRRVMVTLKARFQVDDHDTPSILVRPDGRLMVFWSAHTGNRMYYRTSRRPEDVTAWADNRGSTWSAARTLISNPGQRPYVKFASNDRDTIAMAFTEAHPRDLPTSIYFAEYRAGALRRADGSVISTMTNLPIAPREGEKVYDRTTNGKAWVHDVALDQAGHPVIVYATFPNDTDHRYRYARWNGTRWIDRELVRAGGSMSLDPTEPNYSGGITLDHEDPSTVYLSRQVNGNFEVEVWRTPDGGATWSSQPLTSVSAGNNYRPISPRGQRGDNMNVVWMHGPYPSFRSFQTGLRTQVRTPDNAGPGSVAWGPGPLDVFATDRERHHGVQPTLNGNRNGAVPIDFNTTVVSAATVMADPNPRSTPIPVNEQARAAD